MNRWFFIGAAFGVLLSSPVKASLTCNDVAGASVFSSESAPRYLGFVGSDFGQDSINNRVGSYGSQFASDSVRNEFGTYGSPFSSFSANNPFAVNPPKLIKEGVFIAFLSSNTALPSVSIDALDRGCTFTNGSPANFFTTQAISVPAPATGWGGVDVSVQGSWFNPERDGEGLVLDFFGDSSAPGVIAYFYTYDLEGNQLYLVGSTDQITPGTLDTVNIEMIKTRGAVFGSQFDPNAVERTVWGSLEIDFIDCGQAIVAWFPVIEGYEAGKSEVIRLADLPEGITCP